MHQLQLEPVRQSAQFVISEHWELPAGAAQFSDVTVQSEAGQELTAGPLAVPEKQELLLLHQPHPDFATQEPQSGERVEQASWVAGITEGSPIGGSKGRGGTGSGEIVSFTGGFVIGVLFPVTV
jgi:hypothetical protein